MEPRVSKEMLAQQVQMDPRVILDHVEMQGLLDPQDPRETQVLIQMFKDQ